MNVETVQKALGEFAEDFNYAVEGLFIVARAKAFINNKEAWAEIVKRMKSVNGEWIRAGKQSLFRVPVSHAVEGSAQNVWNKFDQALDLLNEVRKALKQ